MIHVVAVIVAKPGKRSDLLNLFHANMPAVRAEAGCIEYGPAVDADGLGQTTFGPDAFVVLEKWESPEALQAHAASAHMKAYGKASAGMIAERSVYVLTPA